MAKPSKRPLTDEERQVKEWLDTLLPESPLLFVPNNFGKVLKFLKGAPLAVLVAYASHADSETGEAYPSVDFLRKETGYGRNAIKDAREFLVYSGLLTFVRQERKPDGTLGRAIFRVTWTAARN